MLYHGALAAQQARSNWDQKNRNLAEAVLPELALGERRDLLAVLVQAYQSLHVIKSNSDIRRLIMQGSVQWNDEKILDPKAEPIWNEGGVLKLDKKNAVRIRP
jgi:tyrosyl-tRNA synthetase